jgi:hypothetical protein
MTTARRAQLSEIMSIAHNWRRQIGCTLSEALKVAWRTVKRTTAPVVPIVYLKSPIYSPTSRRLAAQPYGRSRDFRTGSLIAAFGR